MATRSELFFSIAGNPGLQIMVATYSATGDSFRADKPKPWSEARVANGNPIGTYGSFNALHPDGGRFAAMPLPATATGSGPRSLVFIFNFFEELKAHALR